MSMVASLTPQQTKQHHPAFLDTFLPSAQAYSLQHRQKQWFSWLELVCGMLSESRWQLCHQLNSSSSSRVREWRQAKQQGPQGHSAHPPVLRYSTRFVTASKSCSNWSNLFRYISQSILKHSCVFVVVSRCVAGAHVIVQRSQCLPTEVSIGHSTACICFAHDEP